MAFSREDRMFGEWRHPRSSAVVPFSRDEWAAIVHAAVCAYEDDDIDLALVLDRVARKMEAALIARDGQTPSWRDMAHNLPHEVYQELASQEQAARLAKRMRGRFR